MLGKSFHPRQPIRRLPVAIVGRWSCLRCHIPRRLFASHSNLDSACLPQNEQAHVLGGTARADFGFNRIKDIWMLGSKPEVAFFVQFRAEPGHREFLGHQLLPFYTNLQNVLNGVHKDTDQ